MKQNLLTKHCALLLLALAAAWSTQAWAEIKIHVKVEGNTNATPYLYMWKTETDLVSATWPGDAMSETVTTADGVTWYVAVINESNFNLIINNNGNNQSREYSDIHGDKYYAYNSNTGECYNLTYQYEVPTEAHYKDGKLFVYFVNTSEWANPKAHVYNSSENIAGDWPGGTMTKVDNTDNLYVWEKESSSTPSNVIFSNNGDNSTQTSAFGFVNGGYYSSAGLITTITKLTLNSTNFPDANFRSALSSALDVSEGENVEPNNVRILDVSNKGITDLTGISHFTNLEELYAGGNDISNNVILTSNPNLRILDLNGNAQLQGTSSQHTPYIDITKCKVLEEINFANTGCTWMGGLQNIDGGGTYSNLKKLNLHNVGMDYMTSATMQKMPNLEWIDLSGNQLTNSQGFSNNTKLKYIDVSDNPQNAKNFVLVALTQLKTFKAANCHLNASQTTYSASDYFPTESVEYVDLSGNTALTTMYCPATNNLKTLIVNGCTGLQGSTSAGALGGSTTYIPRMTHLEHLELNNVDLYLHTGEANGLFTILTPSVAPNLHYIDLSNDQLGSAAKPTFAFPNLDTLLIKNNPILTELIVTSLNAPENLILDVSNDAALTTLAITNSGITQSIMPTITTTGATSLYKLDLTDNAFTDVPTTGIESLTTLVLNNNQLSDINVSEDNINYLYAQNNNFGSGAYTLPTTSLVGLDLGNNGFTKFKAENNTSLKSLALAGNTNLTEIELHGNTALTQTSPDGVIESDNGLYIKGLSNLQTLNIENSSFNKLGQQNSLDGVTGLTKLQARHNEFTTFTNGVYALDVAGTGNYRKPDNTESSLEHLTALEYLDLAYNNLQDSVHLYKNVALKHLDVSHNNEIHGVIDGTITADNTAAQEAMRTKKAKRLVKYGMYYGDKGELTDALYAQACADQAGRQVRFDIRYEDLNDTTGIYHLDLQKNVNLEWIDISYTNIHNTAAGPGVMNPGWMSRDWVGDSDEALAATVHANTTTQRSYSAFHTFVYFAPCSKLKTIHMDHCNLQSLGISYFPELDTLTASYMYGDCYFMRDATKTDLRYGMANTGPGRVRKYLSPKTNTETGIQDAVNVVGPDGTASSYYDNNIKYYDISYSGFNELRFNYGINLEHVNVSGNPLKFHVHPNTDYSYHNSLDVTYCPNIRTVLAENCSDLPIVRAHNRTNLDTLYVSNDPNLKVLYVQNDPLLKTNFAGLNTLTGLETLFGYNNTQWGNDINFSSNTALKNLWISNIGTSSINVANNANLEKLRAYDNSLTALDLSNNGELLWLDVARNKLPEIDLSGNTKLQFFNISNGSDTRTQLDGTEALNHDGSDGDNIKPTTVFNDDEAPIASANNGNSLSDLALPASITDARANGNDLHSITGNFANLTNIEFAHNHINGIDLSAAPGATIESRDNGRTILADCAKFLKKENGVVQEYTVYFFQLDPNVTGNGTVLTLKDSEDLKGDTRRLGTDGMVMDNITWDGTSGSALKNTITPGDMSALDPDDVPGNIVVLNPTSESGNGAEGTATYTYKTGENSTSEFYLNWSSDGTVTGINEIKAEDGVSITNTYGNLTVSGADGTVVGVYDVNGRQVASETIINGSVTIDGLTPGIYVVNGVKVLVK